MAKILLVDDEPNLRLLLEVELSDVGHDVTTAVNASSAIALAAATDFDILMTDLRMPGMTGLELCAWVRQNRPCTDVILMTGYGSSQSAVEGLRLGAADYLFKPFGDIQLVIGSVERLLQKRRLRDETESLKTQLLQMDRLNSLGHLSSAVAHEISNPAGFVLGNLSMLQEDLTTLVAEYPEEKARLDEMTAMVDDAIVGIQRVSDVARDLRAFAGADVGPQQPIRLLEVVETSLRIGKVAVRHRARLTTDLGDIGLVDGQHGRLAQVFINLLLYAADTVPEGNASGHEVHLSMRADGNQAVVEITDTGTLLTDAQRAELFAPLRTNASGVPIGVGLALTRDIVNDHSGDVSVTPGRGGNRYVVQLPLLEPQARRESRPALAPSTGRKALIIDDEEALRRMMTVMLRGRYDVTDVSGGEAALAVLEQDSVFDLVICDLMMPGMDGTSVYQAVCERWPHLATRVLFATGGSVTQATQGFLTDHADRVLYKPFRRDELLAAIAELVLKS